MGLGGDRQLERAPARENDRKSPHRWMLSMGGFRASWRWRSTTFAVFVDASEVVLALAAISFLES